MFAAGSGLDGKGQVVIFRETLPEKIPDDIQKLIAKENLNSGETIKLDKFYLDHVKEVAKVDMGDSGIYAIAVSPDGKTVAAAGSDGKIRLLNVAGGKQARAFVPVKLEGEGVAASTVKAANRG